jgi:RNA polymerase sigma-70 factor (ECF subfamily)
MLRTIREGGLLWILDRGRVHLLMSQTAEKPDAAAIWRELHDRLLGFIARRVRIREDAEDILQEVMLRIHHHSGDLAHTDRLAGWVYRIASNAIADHYRKPARRELPSGQATDVPGRNRSSAAAESELATAELRSELAHCLAPLIESLPAIYRQALRLTEFEGITQTQAAAQLGISASGMKTRVQRARKQLKDLLLDCCHIELDRRGGVTAYRSKRGRAKCADAAKLDESRTTRPTDGPARCCAPRDPGSQAGSPGAAGYGA